MSLLIKVIPAAVLLKASFFPFPAPPRILSLSVQGSEDSGFRAQCEVEGSPLPDIQWVSPDHLLLEGLEVGRPPRQGSSPSRHHAVSQLPDIRPGQQYTCSATNPLGREQATLYLLPPRREACPGATGPPLLLLLSLSLGAKALLLGGVGVWAVLLCTIRRVPEPRRRDLFFRGLFTLSVSPSLVVSHVM
jgi:hypothetical protein